MAICRTKNGLIEISGLTPREAHQIKVAMRFGTMKQLWTLAQKRSFSDRIVGEISEAQSYCVTHQTQES